MRTPSVQTQLKSKGLKLNTQQLAAVKAIEGVSIVSAGAGTGKTSCIVSKIMYAATVKECSSILAVTFTKKAVAELQARIIGVQNVTVCTFHSFFYRILRSFGYKSFRFIETDAQRAEIMRQVLQDKRFSDELTVADIEDAMRKCAFKDVKVKEASECYLDKLKSLRLLDFDALQFFTLELLKMQPAVANRVRNLYDFVLFDETQDMSIVQSDIIKLIWPADKINNLTFVGDKAQSIYGFRGSKADAMDDLQAFYGASTYSLTTNYRSTESILSVANEVLTSSLKMKANRGKGTPPIFHIAETPLDEATWVAEEIKRLHNTGVKLSDIAILFRSSPAVGDLMEQLVEENIPHVKIGSNPLRWDNVRYKAFLALLAFMHDHDNRHYKCALPLLGIPYNAADDMDDELNLPFSELLQGLVAISKEQRSTLQEFFSINPDQRSLRELAIIAWDKWLKTYFKADNDDILDDFLAATEKFQTFAELRLHVNEIRRRVRVMNKLVANPNADYVRLMSIHTAKGLEFSYVFVVGCVEGLFPDTSHDEVNMDEENRIAYVAVTRAKNMLYVSAYSSQKGKVVEPCRFFKEFFS